MGPVTQFTLAGDFPAADREQWRGLVAAVLAKSGVTDADPEAALSTATYDGFDVRPLYTAADLRADFRWPAVIAGAAVESIGWDVRQRHTGTDPAAINAAILADLNNGVTSIWLPLGPGLLEVADLPRVLEGVYLDLAPVVLDAGSGGTQAARAFLSLAVSQGAGAEIAGSLGLDPIGARARTGALVDLAELAEGAALVRDHPRLAAITVDGCLFHEAGASDAQELALVAASVVAYLRVLTGAGWTAAEALARIECRYAVTADQFASIAKLRAARRIWARIASLSGVEGSVQRQHAVTSRAMLTRRDPWVNLLRTTVACFAAAVAGADAITVEPFDSAIGQPDDFGRRLARNTQSILHDESSLARVADPAAGSWYVESRTDSLAHSAWDIFTHVERMGGAVAALESGQYRSLFGATSDRRLDAITHRTAPLTGVSEYAFPGEEKVVREPYAALASDRPEGGLLTATRWAAPFEALRDRADNAPARPTVFLAALGPASAHSGRVGFATNLFNAGGIESVVATGSIEELVAAFTATGTSVACLCSSDRVYADQAAEVSAALVAAGASLVWLAGLPGERAESDAAAGITGYVFVGADALDILERTFDALAVAE